VKRIEQAPKTINDKIDGEDDKDLDHFIWGPAPKPPGFNAFETKV
jgi:hypothetical protein